MRMILRIALRNLIQARRRTFFLTIGLAFVTFMLVVLQAFSRSVGENLLRAATTLSSGHVNVAGFTKANPNEAAPYISNRETVRQVVRETLPDVDFVVDRVRGWAQLSSETDSLQTGVVGIDMSEEQRLTELLALAREDEYRDGGRREVLGDVARLGEPGAIVIFAAHARQLGVTVGDGLTVISTTPDGLTNTLDLTVVGVARDISMMSSWTVFVPADELRSLYQLTPDTAGAVEVFLRDPGRAEAAMAELRQAFADRGYPIMEYDPQPFWAKFETVSAEDWIGQKLEFTVWRDEVKYIVWILTVIDIVSAFLVGVLMIIIGIGVTNTMWIAVRERTSEIGTLRAIGMSGRRVLAMFLSEAAILGLGATLAGALLGAAVALGVDRAGVPLPEGPMQAFLMSDTLRLYVLPAHLVIGVLTITLVTTLAALWPSLRAARLQPITAIHHVD